VVVCVLCCISGDVWLSLRNSQFFKGFCLHTADRLVPVPCMNCQWLSHCHLPDAAASLSLELSARRWRVRKLHCKKLQHALLLVFSWAPWFPKMVLGSAGERF
jgi:hypothetical protein